MKTPAQRHTERMNAAMLGTDNAIMNKAASTQYELMLMQLSEHRRRLKKIQSIERKIEVKRQLLPEYDAYMQGVLQSNRGRQDDVLMTVMVWYIDTGEIEKALTIAEYALKHDLQTPDRYERNTACLIAEEIADTSLKLMDGENAVSSDLIGQTIAITEDHDMFDQVRARLLKAYGMSLIGSDAKEAAIEPLERALELDDRSGVKKLIEQTKRDIKKNSAKPEEPVTEESAQEEPETENSEQEQPKS